MNTSNTPYSFGAMFASVAFTALAVVTSYAIPVVTGTMSEARAAAPSSLEILLHSVASRPMWDRW